MPQYDYERVADDLRQRIEDGTYPPGSKLPSRREMKEIYEVSQIVVDRAMWMLAREGLTETLPGVGVYVKAR
jgi:GntR family transcriptional regulator